MAAKQDSNSRPRKKQNPTSLRRSVSRFLLRLFLHNLFGAGVLRQLLFGFSLFSVPPAGRLRAPPGSPHRDGAQGSPCRGAIPRSQSGTSIPEHAPAPKRPAKSQPDPRTNPRAGAPYQATTPKRRTKPRAETPCRDATPERHTKPPHRSAAPTPTPECHTGTPHRSATPSPAPECHAKPPRRLFKPANGTLFSQVRQKINKVLCPSGALKNYPRAQHVK